jgi:hypothetical protein
MLLLLHRLFLFFFSSWSSDDDKEEDDDDDEEVESAVAPGFSMALAVLRGCSELWALVVLHSLAPFTGHSRMIE